MDNLINWIQSSLTTHGLTPEQAALVAMAAGLVVLAILAWLGNFVAKQVILRVVTLVVKRTDFQWDDALLKAGFFSRLSHLAPAMVIDFVGPDVLGGTPEVLAGVHAAVDIYLVCIWLGVFFAILDAIHDLAQQSGRAKRVPVKGFVQAVKLLATLVGLILILATVLGKSPVYLLSGLGALTAVLLLVFRDAILGFVAGIMISVNEMVRIGDWIEMPKAGADGDVIDVSLTTVKVQNWDKTITSIPTKRFISDSFKNWRGMQESGGRRIKRSLFLDQQSVHFLDAEERKRLYRFSLLEDYLVNKRKEIDEWNAKLAERGQEPVNTRRATNIGTFRAYVERYLRAHPGVHQNMTLLVRQLSPTADGLPLEIYCFTNTVVWAQYEAIQSDIFDHLLAILPEFGLRVFQHPSGSDMRDWRQSLESRDAPALQQPDEHPAEVVG